MAEQTGVTQPTGTRRSRGTRGFLKRNRLAVVGGGGILALLLMSHKGGKGASPDPSVAAQDAASVQAQQDQVAAEQAALENATPAVGGFGVSGGDGGLGSTASGLVGPGDGTAAGGLLGAGDGTTGTTTDGGAIGGSAPVGPINVTVNTPGARKHPKRQQRKAAASAHAKASGKNRAKTQASKQRGTPSQHGGAHGTRSSVRPGQAARGKPAPAHSGGGHPETAHRTAHGRKKRSPAEAESPFGIGAGVVVMGRQFVGAQGYRLGPPLQASNGEMCRRVIVDYGGRTEQFIAHGNGTRWTDNPAGVNPPSRGVPFESAAVPV